MCWCSGVLSIVTASTSIGLGYEHKSNHPKGVSGDSVHPCMTCAQAVKQGWGGRQTIDYSESSGHELAEPISIAYHGLRRPCMLDLL
jgi:hypothetical protein